MILGALYSRMDIEKSNILKLDVIKSKIFRERDRVQIV